MQRVLPTQFWHGQCLHHHHKHRGIDIDIDIDGGVSAQLEVHRYFRHPLQKQQMMKTQEYHHHQQHA
jgi:hypothetical protein